MKNQCLFLLFLLVTISGIYAQMGPRQPNPQLASQPTQGQLRELFAGPATPGGYAVWLDSMQQWRNKLRDSLQFDASRYLRPELSWTTTTFMYAQVMAHDRYLYDPIKRVYTVDRYLQDVTKRYGGLDGVLIWPTYPNIGVDNRNQLDYWDDMPGGKKGIATMVSAFKKRGVRVFFPIMIWDHGTRKLEWTMAVSLTLAMKEIGADGLNGDTMFGVTEDYKAAYDSLGYTIALQPELSLRNLKMAEWNTMSWGYFWEYAKIPGVSIYKWLEPRHQVHITNRWVTNRTNDLQYAFFNGIGYNTWENIWGIWNQVPERYAEAIRRIRTIYQQFPTIWSNAGWSPHVPVLQPGIFASKFPGIGQTVYTFVNRDSIDTKGNQVELNDQEGATYFDIWNGLPLVPLRKEGKVYLSFPIEKNGFGAIVAIAAPATDPSFNNFLMKMKTLSAKPLQSYSANWKEIPQRIVDIKPTKKIKIVPPDMILVPATKSYNFQSVGVMIEGNELPKAVGVQHPWEAHPSRSQTHVMAIASFYIDAYNVTNKQFKKFLAATNYRPKDDHNFLKDWSDGNYPLAIENAPVTWVSIEDARAYASWAGKRLPHEWEWQYAAQGTDERLYPWGAKDSTRMPLPDTSLDMRKPTAVNAYLQGASLLGIKDLVGNVWQWTDEYTDEHTRSAILKGGSYFQAKTSRWYFPQAYELNKYGKYLLMSPGLDRAATIGFRCVLDK
ncbi:MAG: hypothetical protein JWP81_594 [Ferruginibacter sp.]|nr:hypothetical protein [Ferruginibacter sp.]